jgi:hypothetical protein
MLCSILNNEIIFLSVEKNEYVSGLDRLLKNPSHVIARSSFCYEAISNPLILLKARLPRFARNDRKKTFSTAC